MGTMAHDPAAPDPDHDGDQDDSLPESLEQELRLRAVAGLAVEAARGGQDRDVLNALSELATRSINSRTDFREVVSVLLRGAGEMARGLSATTGTQGLEVHVTTSAGQRLTIDQTDPPLRTAARALLAHTHGDEEMAETHLDIAFDQAEPAQLMTMVMHSVRWAARFATECEARDIPVPTWITVHRP